MRALLRMLTVMLAVAVAALGGLGLAFEKGGDDLFSRFQRTAIERTRTWAQEQKLPTQEQTRYVEAIEQGTGALRRLGQPAAYGTLFGLALGLLGIALIGMRPPPSAKKAAAKGKSGKAKTKTKGKAKGKGGAEPEVAETATATFQDEAPEHTGRERKKLLKAAAQLEKDEGADAAADLLIEQGLRDEAVELLLREGLVGRAAEVRHDQNRFEEAADLFAKAEQWERAAKIYTQIEKYAEAARCYVSADKKSVAGEMYERAERYREAGDCYREIGFGRHAAQAYLKAGADAQAAEALVEVFHDEGGVAAAKADSQVKEMRSIAKKAGDLLFRLERFEEAESIFSKAELWGAAAKVAYHRGNHAAAAEWFRKVGRGDLAARALEELGDEKGAALAMGAYQRDQGNLEEAAEYLARAEEWVEAAGVFRSLERYKEAGQCYAQAHDYGAAAEMFRGAGELARAGEAYAQSRQYVEAAKCFEEAGKTDRQAEMLEKAQRVYEAGVAHLNDGRHEDAIRLLQLVPEDDANFGQASSLLGRLFSERGMDTLSLKKFEQATADTAVSPGTVEAYYGLGRALEKRGNVEKAVETYESILAFDYQYEDVQQRVERLKAQERENARTAQAAGRGVGGDPPTSAGGDGTSRYEVSREIGRGGMGVVFLARDTLLERDVAYKVLPEQLRENPDALRNFLREAKAAAQLNHPHIVTVYDVGESEHGYYLAMEYVEGTTLKEIVQKRGPIAPGGLVYILRQMAEALGYAHSKKVVHRDIKTANIMWTTDKQVKIMDFGLARLLEEVRNATTTISGTPFYMSPEQTLGKSVDHRTDLYSLGVTLFELATGQLPFRRGNVPYHHVHTPAPDPRTFNPKLPAPIAEVTLRCLEKAPDARYANAKEIVDDLAQRMKAAKDPA